MIFQVPFSVVFPLCVYLSIGMLSKRFKLLDEHSVSKVNAMAFRFLFPVLMFNNIQSSGDSFASDDMKIAWIALIIAIFLFAVLATVIPIFVKDRARQATVILGSYRGNGLFFAIPILTSLFGDAYTGICAVCISFLVPLYNVLSVVLFRVKSGEKPDGKALVIGVIKNPIIIGSILGALVILLNLTIPPLVQKVVDTLSAMVTPLALILLGATLRFDSIKKNILHLSIVVVIKLIIYPVAVVLLACLLGCHDRGLICLFTVNCLPTAVGTYTMAKEMGPDGEFMAEIVATTTVLSIVTVFFWIVLFEWLGVI